MATEMNGSIEIGVDTLRVEGDPTKLYEALAKAQGEFPDIPRLSEGQAGSRKFGYAGYATIMKCVRPALTKHGIAILQPLHSRESPVTTTILAGHGASIISSLSFPQQKDPQDFGKHHTYYRRYQLQSMLGLEGDKDADESDIPERSAQSFSEPAKKEEPKPVPKEVSAAKKSAAAEPPKTNGSAKVSASTTNGSAKVDAQGQASLVTGESEARPKSTEKKPGTPQEIVDAIPPEKLNSYLTSVMKQMNPPWKVIDIRNFYAHHFDADNEMPAPDSMDPTLKRALLTKIIEVEKVAPF